MRSSYYPVFAFLAFMACDRGVRDEPSTPVAIAPTAVTEVRAEPDDAEPTAPAPAAQSPWSRLLAAHGAGLAGVTLAEAKRASFNVSRNELIVMFDWPMQMGDDNIIRPGRQIDYGALAQKLGAKSVGGVPPEFHMMCGGNHGGDFEVDGARYGVYVSGGCHHVRIFDATPDAVRLILGEEFVSMLSECTVRALRACRTSDELRVEFDGEVDAAFAAMEPAGGTKLAPTGEGGWMSGKPTEYGADKSYVEISYPGATISCGTDMPDLSEPSVCGMSGTTHQINDVCRGSGSCKEAGLCAMVDGDCRATSPVHCEKSRGCFQEGRCTPADGACVATPEGCKAWKMCGLQGLCTLEKDRCVAAGDDCRGLDSCAKSGACTPVDGRCKPASDADCAGSERCREDGTCGFRSGRCTQVTEAQCRQTESCKERGYCLLAKDGAGCAQCWVSDPAWPRDKWSWAGGKCKKVR